MPSLTLNLANQATPVFGGHLADLHALQHSVFTLASDVFTAAILDGPISHLSHDFLKGDLSVGINHQWKQTIDSDTSITFGLSPDIKCSVIVRRAGTVFPSSLSDIKSDPTTTKTISVPDGKAYISIVLSVSLDVTAKGAFTNGVLGVSSGIDAKDTFGLSDHFLCEPSRPLRDAIVDAFSRFTLPFGPDINDLNNLQTGDIVESEFVGSLALSTSLTTGFSGVLFGAFGTGGLSLSGNSPLGSVLACAKPTFKLGPSFEVDYTHTDAFRMVIHVQQSEVDLLYFKRKTNDLKTKIDASVTLGPGVTTTFTGQVSTLLNASAQKLVAEADSTLAHAFADGVAKLVSVAAQSITDATNELNSVIPNRLKKLPSLGVDASATLGTVTQHTIFGVFVASRPGNAAAWKLAMAGDLQSALHLPGLQLGSGSYVENSLTKSTTLCFVFFGLKAQTVERYINDVTLTYAGNGQFQYRLKTGITATSNIFGHQKEADFYFLVDASLARDGVLNHEDVTLNVVRRDQNSTDRSFSLGKTISLILPPSQGQAIALRLAAATKQNPKVPVTLTAQFAASALAKITATPFVNGKPQPLAAQVDDQKNFALFTKAIDDVASSSDHFPDSLNDYGKVWARVNENLIGQPGGPPDRTQTGPLSNPAQAFEGLGQFESFSDLDLARFLLFLEEARRFMNLCADLQQLAILSGDPESSEPLANLVDLVTKIGKSDATASPLELLNAVLLALVRRTGATPTIVSAPTGSDGSNFNLTVLYS